MNKLKKSLIQRMLWPFVYWETDSGQTFAETVIALSLMTICLIALSPWFFQLLQMLSYIYDANMTNKEIIVFDSMLRSTLQRIQFPESYNSETVRLSNDYLRFPYVDGDESKYFCVQHKNGLIKLSVNNEFSKQFQARLLNALFEHEEFRKIEILIAWKGFGEVLFIEVLP